MKQLIKVEVKEPQYLVDTDVTYAQVDKWFGHMKQDLKLDIIYPEHAEKRPCIVWICGGAWMIMEKSAHLVYLCDLARQGFVVASVQYRTSNEVNFPGQLEDVKAAIRYLRAHSDFYGIDPEHFGVMGESAGGHLTAMTALTGKRKEFDKGAYLEYSSEVQAAIPWYLPADLSKMPCGDPDELAAAPESLLIGKHAVIHAEDALSASPISYAAKDAPPMLLLHGTDDHTVPYEQSERMYEALEQAGADVSLIALEGADHADLPFFQREVWEIITKFFKEKLG